MNKYMNKNMLKELFDTKIAYLKARENTYEKVDLRKEYFKLLDRMSEKYGNDIDIFDELISIACFNGKTFEQTLNAYKALGGDINV